MYKKILICCLLLTLYGYTLAQEEPTIVKNCDIVTNTLVESSDLNFFGDKKSPGHKSTRNLIQSYCSALEFSNLACNEKEGQIYNYKESLFTYFLCESVGADISHFNPTFKTQGGILKKDKVIQLGGLIDGWFNSWNKDRNTYCNPKISTQINCPIWDYYPYIFQLIINDYFNIRQARVFSSLDNKLTPKKKANSFSEEYFQGLKICEDKNYHKTCKKLKDYLKHSSKITKKTRILNTEEVTKNAQKCDNEKGSGFIFCGLSNTYDSTDTAFINLVYNELYWYRIFLQYYISYVNETPTDFLPLHYQSYGKNSQVIKKESSRRIRIFTDKSQRLTNAIYQSVKRLNSIKNTFPIHIGLLMYQEDLVKVRNALGSMYTPIRTLYDKLRNVQNQNS